MGRPEADSSSYESVHPQEDQYEQTQGDFSSHEYETNYDDPSQSQYGDATANNPQDQQQPPQQQQQPPPQANQGYGGQPAHPSQFPPQGRQTNPMYSNGPKQPAPYPPQRPQANPTQPAPYPPQANPTQPAPYPTQANPTQPVPYPPPQANPTHPGPYPPQGNPNQPAPYPPQGPTQFPPQSPMKPAAYPPQGPHTFPNQPAQFPPQSPQMNPMYNNGLNQPANFPPQSPQQMPQAFQPQAFQNAYQSPQVQAQPQVAPYPPKSPVNGIPIAPVNQQQQAWTTGIFDCLDDPSNALITALFPCVTFGQVAEIVDNGQTTCGTNGMMYGLVAFCIGMPCLVSCGYRSKLRAKYGLIEDPAPDWLTHGLFEWCALCQEYRELNNRGLDPSIGTAFLTLDFLEALFFPINRVLICCCFCRMAGKYIQAKYAAGSSWYGASDEPKNDALMLMLNTRDTDVIYVCQFFLLQSQPPCFVFNVIS
ncbi:hypothetical protein SADUNF_Sadunf12G0046100 [Salix dunnii]|uniref:Uncharacterized protein n=1 Tax=Salix dunnii TaxID=1413687 RepID=A0A835MVU1_9ROSI|nr:hypothetical protein SADUNF_Sadunf12G0046100 [Salix dunnii]